MHAVFRLDSMSMPVRLSTAVVLGAAPLLGAIDYLSPHPLTRWLPVLGAAISLYALYAWLWLRPTHFVIKSLSLSVHWPLRREEIALGDITSVRIVSWAEMLSAIGNKTRIGNNGVFGTFTRVRSEKQPFHLWTTRHDRVVVIERRGTDATLVLTPELPDRFVQLLEEQRGVSIDEATDTTTDEADNEAS